MRNTFPRLVSSLRSLLRGELTPYLVLALIALGMRLWELGWRAISHDESLHAMYSWYLYRGQGYEHNPMMHGPFQFFGTALNFFIFGDSDFTARLLPALFGAALVVLPYFLRRQLGRWGGIAAATLLAFSPTLLYFSRYARNDIYVAFWTLLLVVCLWRYVEEKRARYLYIAAAALSLSFCTLELSYFIVVVLAGFLLFVVGRELAARARRRFDLSGLSAPADYLILVATLSLPLFAAAVELIPGVSLPPGVTWEKALTVSLLFAFSALVGLRWDWRRWLWSALIFYGIFTLLYTTFFTHPSGFGSGIWGSMEYWIQQHGVARGGQPWYYYLVLLPFYEFLPLILAAAGAIYFAVKGGLFSRFLIFWAAASLILLSWFGEKMPWLSVHMLLPIILLGGAFVGRLFQEVNWRPLRARALQGSAILLLLLLFTFNLRVAWQASYQRGDVPVEMLVYAGISCDVPHIMGEIEEVAEETGEGKGLAITVDSALTWPWVWYLRDYNNVDYPDLSSMGHEPRGSVLLLGAGNEWGAQPYLGKYGEGQRFKQLLWFPEEYKGLGIGDLIKADTWKRWWGYFLHRETLSPYWSSQGIAYFAESAP